jgi:DNA-binding Lrp family transcriptional regulator
MQMPLKELDFRILAELMRNAKASDRVLAKRLGVSQPTVTRRRARLEQEGIIKEYTVIPDYPKAGYHIMAITLLKYETDAGIDEILEARKRAKEIVKDSPAEIVLAERGIGIDYHGVTISFHQDYAAFVKFRDAMRLALPVKAVKLDSFIVNLDDEFRYRPLTFSTLAQHLQTLHKQ